MAALDPKYRRLRQELIGGVVALGIVFLIGTLWYRFVEQWTWLDAAYMTMSTLATVGFGEINPLGERGRLFTMVLIVMGLITIGYIVNRFTEALIQGYFQAGIRRRQEKRLIETLVEHYIVCGFGRTGRQVALEFQAEGIPFVLVDSDPEQIEKAKGLGYRVILGDATLDESLLAAKIDTAACIVAALTSDAENLYTVLSAKTLNPRIRAIARASTEEAVQKLQRAGADAVVSPYITGGRRLAAAALRPQVMDFVDGILTGTNSAFYMEEFLIDPKTCPCVGQTLSEARLRSQSGALVLAVRRADGTLIGGPTGDTVLMAGDLLICMGTPEQLRSLTQILLPIRSSSPLRLPKKQ
ncbi:K+ transport system, NAD-binding component [Pleurocapsa sp. PCC 7327]|uniref:potassium channel family protein n=1 Tax=Pleurocapsa sp. PCC 7327 TaxID=118163 RepID=UPI00029FF2A7|nr:potassium channel protein [Pleurocapsa sp. PCC 7327]AFY78167.1 K+ transport system, NAD-binding component [Pleurocapsa sp. PCC 7327]